VFASTGWVARTKQHGWPQIRCDENCDCLNREKLKACRKLCKGRPGLPLLRTCRQIYEEASPVFWKNMFCFSSCMQFIKLLERQPQSTFDKIQRISVLEMDDWEELDMFTIFAVRMARDKADELLARLNNLVELELPPKWLRLAGLEDLLSLNGLRHVRGVVYHPVLLGPGWEHLAEFRVRVAKDIIPGPCRELWWRKHFFGGPQLGEDSCAGCWRGSTEEAAWKQAMASRYREETPNAIIDVVSPRLRQIYRWKPIPAYDGRDPQPIVPKLARSLGLDIAIIGLSVLGAEERRPLRSRLKHEMWRENGLVLPKTKKVRPQEFITTKIDEIEVASPAQSRHGRLVRTKNLKKSGEVEREEEELVRTRQQKIAERENNETVRAKKGPKRARRSVKRSMKEIEASRKDGRKRVSL